MLHGRKCKRASANFPKKEQSDSCKSIFFLLMPFCSKSSFSPCDGKKLTAVMIFHGVLEDFWSPQDRNGTGWHCMGPGMGKVVI